MKTFFADQKRNTLKVIDKLYNDSHDEVTGMLNLFVLMYADDTVIMAENEHDMQSSKVNLTVNTPEIPTTLFYSANTTHNGGKLAKEEVMPTWAASKSLLLSQSSQSHGRTNAKVIASLFRTSPTNHIRIVCESCLRWNPHCRRCTHCSSQTWLLVYKLQLVQ